MTTEQAAAPEKSSNFFLGFLLLPKPKRDALSAIYAYCRRVDDIVDDGRLSKDDAARELDFWRAEVERLYEGKPGHPLSRALERPVADYGIPKESLLEMIRGCAMDLEGTRYETLEELESYMRGVASSVGVMCVHVFGWEHTPRERAYEFARDFGYAFQLTNIVRDVGADLDLGRVYLPASELRAAGYSEERLRRRDDGPEFRRVMEGLHARAKAYYARARALVDPRDRRALLPAEIMAHVYEGVLDRVKAEGYPVLRRKVSLPPHKKLALAARAWLASR